MFSCSTVTEMLGVAIIFVLAGIGCIYGGIAAARVEIPNGPPVPEVKKAWQRVALVTLGFVFILIGIWLVLPRSKPIVAPNTNPLLPPAPKPTNEADNKALPAARLAKELSVGQERDENRGFVRVRDAQEELQNLSIGYVVTEGTGSWVPLYRGIAPVNDGLVSAIKNFRGGQTSPLGYTLLESAKRPDSIQLWEVTGDPINPAGPNRSTCSDNKGMVSTNKTHLNCVCDSIGYTYR
jgi:hypothetical protein